MNLLIVDDSKLNLAHAVDTLKENEIVCNIFTANSGEEALNIINNNDIDIILLDIIMPKITGLEVLERIREDSKYKDLIVIMFTSLTDNKYLKMSFDLGANDYINKPINQIEFISRIKGAMRLRKHQMDIYNLMYVLEEKNKKLEETTLKLKKTQSQLIVSEKLSALGKFAAGIAHEINNPLGYISSNNETLMKYFTSYIKLIDKYNQLSKKIVFKEEQEEITNLIESIEEFKQDISFDFINEDYLQLLDDSSKGIERIKNIVQSLMNFTRLEIKSRFKANDFNKIILDTVKPLQDDFKDIVDIELNLGNLENIICDSIQINQVIYHIVINAIQAIESFNTEAKGKIKIATYAEKNNIKCDIWNNGPGIKEEIINKIFDPFFSTKNIGEGTGLGLNICYDIIVNKYNGELKVESNDKNGTKFTIILPLDNNESEE